MKIDITKDREIRLRDVFNGVIFETDEGEKSGISLKDLILKTGISCPSCYEYTIKAKDGYQQTVVGR